MPGFALDKLKPWIHRSARVSKKSSLPMARGLAPASPIEAFGLPPRPQGMNAREFAISLLRAGAEIEHSFLVQYLYAAYSVDERSEYDTRNTGLQWKTGMRLIAREEMARLATVQNLLLSFAHPFNLKVNDPVPLPSDLSGRPDVLTSLPVN